MRWYKADLHVHSVLSPCSGMEMSPRSMMQKAKENGIEIIAVTDHNSMANCRIYEKAAQEFNIAFIYGVEVQSAEEVHIIALFDNWEEAREFNRKLFDSLLSFKNDPDFFGDQVVLDEKESIVRTVNKALINSSVWTFETIVKKVRKHKGFAFPAHVDVTPHSLLGQLGVIPSGLDIKAVGITAGCDVDSLLQHYPFLQNYTLIRSSDAHCLQDLGSGSTEFLLEEPTLQEIIRSINDKNSIRINSVNNKENLKSS